MKKRPLISLLLAGGLFLAAIFATGSPASAAPAPTIRGIDVSKWQGTINWTSAAKDGVRFAMLRSSYGDGSSAYVNNGTDPMFAANYKNSKAAGVPIGAYHYSYASSTEDAAREADFLISQLKGRRFEYPVAVDIEDSTAQGGLDVKTRTDIALVYLTKLKAAGYYPMLYSNKNWLTTQFDNRITAYDRWVAEWSGTLTYPGATLWQHSATGTVKGISGPVDLDKSFVDYPGKIKALHLNGY